MSVRSERAVPLSRSRPMLSEFRRPASAADHNIAWRSHSRAASEACVPLTNPVFALVVRASLCIQQQRCRCSRRPSSESSWKIALPLQRTSTCVACLINWRTSDHGIWRIRGELVNGDGRINPASQQKRAIRLLRQMPEVI